MLQNFQYILFGRSLTGRAMRFKSLLLAVAAGFSLLSLTQKLNKKNALKFSEHLIF